MKDHPGRASGPLPLQRLRAHIGDHTVELACQFDVTVAEHYCSCSLESDERACQHILAALMLLGILGQGARS